ncbi:MAG: proline iminopeptidase [Gammaproteobacteria bacterium]|jgi:proline iminopeptidase
MRSVYPATKSSRSEFIDVGDGHQIYIEQGGDANGIPVVFLHGGPGAGCKSSHRQFFAPDKYRSVLVDQRGAGRSTPYGGTDANSTQHLAADLEQIRTYLGIDKWVLFGGSWGAALALYYAQTYPERVLGMVLRGTFLARSRDVDWFFTEGASRLLPRGWDAFKQVVGDPPDMATFLYDSVFGDDSGAAERVARAWAQWSGEVVCYAIDNVGAQGSEALSSVMAKARLEFHYAKNAYFIRENQLLEDADKLPDVPVMIVHGQRDLTCTPDAAWALHKAIPDSTLRILRTAGHLSSESLMTEALLDAADEMVELLTPRRDI